MTGFKQIAVYFFVLLLSAGLLTGIYFTEQGLDEQVRTNHLRFEGDVNSAPPLVAITTMALGSFRGLIADVLWIRADNLKDQGNYIETVQLANWITDLQPTFSGMTVYLAWDMAYNISVTCSRREDRWRWVQEGIRLIRDKALAYNPEDPDLYADLAWTFQHKMGQALDDANQYYKNQWGLGMNRIIGVSPDWEKYQGRPLGEKAFSERWDKNHPLWKIEPGITDFRSLLAFYMEKDALPESFAASLGAEEYDALNWIMRANWLHANTKMDPAVILEINTEYGDLDWRTMEAQSIYWSVVALKKMPEHHSLRCERMITQALAISFVNGRFVYFDDETMGRVIQMPNLGLADAALKAYNQAYETNKTVSFLSARQNFYKDAIVLLYSYGREKEARAYYEAYKNDEIAVLKETNPNAPPPKFPPFAEFAKREWEDDIRNANNMRISGLLLSRLVEMFRYLGEGDFEAARQFQEQARFIYDDYGRSINTDAKRVERVGLAPFDQYITYAYIVLANMLTPAEKAQLDAYIGEMVRQEAQAREEAEARAAAEAAAASQLR